MKKVEHRQLASGLRSSRLKGLRHLRKVTDLKKQGGIYKTRVRLDIQMGPLPRRYAHARIVERRPIRAWVFTKEPFQRYQRSLDVQKVVAPPLDIFPEAETLLVIAQIPGAAEKNVKVEIKDDILMLEAHGHTRMGHVKYHKEVLLPFEVDASSIQSSFSDSLLQLDLKRKPSNETTVEEKSKRRQKQGRRGARNR